MIRTDVLVHQCARARGPVCLCSLPYHNAVAALLPAVCPGDGSDADECGESGSEGERQQQRPRKRHQQQEPARPQRQKRRAAGQVDYRLLHEQLFGFAAFDADEDLFREGDDEDFDSDQGTADSDD